VEFNFADFGSIPRNLIFFLSLRKEDQNGREMRVKMGERVKIEN